MGVLSLVGTAVLPSGTASVTGDSSASQLLSDASVRRPVGSMVSAADKTTPSHDADAGRRDQRSHGWRDAYQSAPLQVDLIGGSIYVTGNEEALEQSLAITAAQAQPYAGKWIVVHSTDAPFQLPAQHLTISSTINVFTPTQKGLKHRKLQKIGKVRALPIQASGNLPKGTSGSVTLFVSPKAPHLPLGVVTRRRQQDGPVE